MYLMQKVFLIDFAKLNREHQMHFWSILLCKIEGTAQQSQPSFD